MYDNYHCKSSYQTERGLENATLKCKEDINCAMVSSLTCDDIDSEYLLCNESTKMIPNLEACTLWKRGSIVTIPCFEIKIGCLY